MLDKNDLQAIGGLILASERRTGERIGALEGRLQKLEERFTQQEVWIEERFKQQDAKIEERFKQQDAKLEKRVVASESMLLEEMERMDRRNERRFSKLEQDIEELKDIYRMTKNENDTIQMILHIQEDMEKRLTAIEQKIA